MPEAASVEPMREAFYGWYVVACAFLIAVWGWGLGCYGPAIYLVVLRDIHGWLASTISSAMSAYYLVGAGMIALIGRVVRRFGPMPTILTGVVAMATSLMALTLMAEPWQLYLTFLLVAVGWATMSSAMVNIRLAPWFERKRGLAVSLAMKGASRVGGVIAPGVLALVHVAGFQRGLAAATLTMLAMLVPLAATVARRRPRVAAAE